MLKKAVIYCRTACREQGNENLTLVGQTEMCLAFAEELGRFEVIKVITEMGASNANGKQDRLVKLFGALKEKDAEALIAYDTSRLSRNYDEYKNFKKSLDISGIELVTVTLNLYELNDMLMRHYKKELNYRVRRGIAEAKKRKNLIKNYE